MIALTWNILNHFNEWEMYCCYIVVLCPCFITYWNILHGQKHVFQIQTWKYFIPQRNKTHYYWSYHNMLGSWYLQQYMIMDSTTFVRLSQQSHICIVFRRHKHNNFCQFWFVDSLLIGHNLTIWESVYSGALSPKCSVYSRRFINIYLLYKVL